MMRLFLHWSLGDWLCGFRLRWTGPLPLCMLYVLRADLLEEDELRLCIRKWKSLSDTRPDCMSPKTPLLAGHGVN